MLWTRENLFKGIDRHTDSIVYYCSVDKMTLQYVAHFHALYTTVCISKRSKLPINLRLVTAFYCLRQWHHAGDYNGYSIWIYYGNEKPLMSDVVIHDNYFRNNYRKDQGFFIGFYHEGIGGENFATEAFVVTNNIFESLNHQVMRIQRDLYVQGSVIHADATTWFNTIASLS